MIILWIFYRSESKDRDRKDRKSIKGKDDKRNFERDRRSKERDRKDRSPVRSRSRDRLKDKRNDRRKGKRNIFFRK